MPNPYELQQEQLRGHETLDTVDYYLHETFDFTAFSEALQKPAPSEIGLHAFERPLQYAKIPSFDTQFYSTRYGITAQPLAELAVPGGGKTYDKREDLHLPGKNYKVHGARFAVMHTLNDHPESRIMATASAGNHGISLAAVVNQLNQQLPRALQREAHIYCREDISPAKKERLEALGAKIFAHYLTLEEAMATVDALANRDDNVAYIHPFDDALTIAGQATIEFETFAMLKARGVDLRNTSFRRYVPVGGGGYLAGTAYAWNMLRSWGLLSEDSKLYGVEVEQNDSMARALADRPDLVPHTTDVPDGPDTLDTTSDGTATLRAGHNTLPIIREHTSGVKVIPKEHLIRACGELANSHQGRAPELAGALSFGGLLYDIDQSNSVGTEYVNLTTTTGSNIAPSMLQQLSSEWLDKSSCDIKTKVAALALLRASEGLDAPTLYDEAHASANRKTKRLPPGANRLNVWRGHVER